MEFQLSAKERLFQQEVRDFIARELTPEMRQEIQRAEGVFNGMIPGPWDLTRSFIRRAGEKRWFGIALPTRYGGLGRSFMEQFIVMDEMGYHGVPLNRRSIGIIAADLMVYGSEEHKKEFLPRIARHELEFCIGYSEPGAGSDLAGLQTRAVEDRDDYIINGQKIWTSEAHTSDYCWLLARTAPDAPKHKGLSVFVIPVNSPGITIRPIINMSGWHHFNEFYLDNVRVPKRCLVGEKNRGWYHVAVALDYERTPIVFCIGPARRALDGLLQYARETRRRGRLLAREPLVRHKLADLAVELQVGYVLSYRVLWMMDRGQVPNFESSLMKVFVSELSQRVPRVGMEILGPYGRLLPGSPRAQLGGMVASTSLIHLSTTIAGGTSEVQRSIIAQRGLGLPR